MKVRLGLAGAAALVLAAPGVAGAAPAVTKVTGGGQTLVNGKDTIGFNAQTDGVTHKGQVQFVDRADTGTQTQYHGDVACVAVARDSEGNQVPNAAIVSGTWRKVNGKTDPGAVGWFTLYVQDNGEGANSAGDQILMNHNETDDPEDDSDPTGPDCSVAWSDETIELARGNVQFHKGKPSRRGTRSSKRSPAKATAPKVVSLAGLR